MMADTRIKSWLCQTYTNAVDRSAVQPTLTEKQKSALVFSPHQDDETLGCGGTIIAKRAAGADITIVFMTDGRSSHSHLIPASELIALRKHEAIDACRELGVAPENVLFLDFEDGCLAAHHTAAVKRVITILQARQPDEIFMPYYREPTADHIATNQIVLAALEKSAIQSTIYEYPVWFWHHWPWVSIRQHTPPGTRSVLKNTFASGMGRRLVQDFHVAVNVEAVLVRKKAALNRHRSQMTRLIPDSRWLTLHDVSDGEFLACFFQAHERFHRYEFGTGRRV